MQELPSLILILCITVFVIWSTYKKGFFSTLYKWMPPVLLLYLLPALATNTGVVQPGNGVRVLAMNTILPLSLIMLTGVIHVPGLLRVTRKGLLVFFAGTAGILIGGPLALQMAGLFDPELLQHEGGNAAWRGLVCITGSWINGTPGQLSMREVYGSTEELFLTSLATDIILQNMWLFFLLYSVKFHKRMASIGLQLDLEHVQINPVFFAIGIIWLLIHLSILLISARWLKAPWHYIAIGSEANIGGPASASIVASSFHPGLVSLGILLGILSNLIGNYANLLGGLLFQVITR